MTDDNPLPFSSLIDGDAGTNTDKVVLPAFVSPKLRRLHVTHPCRMKPLLLPCIFSNSAVYEDTPVPLVATRSLQHPLPCQSRARRSSSAPQSASCAEKHGPRLGSPSLSRADALAMIRFRIVAAQNISPRVVEG